MRQMKLTSTYGACKNVTMKKGSHHSPEVIEKLRRIGRAYPASRLAGMLTACRTPEALARRSQSMKERYPAGPTHYNFGKKRSEEARNKMRKAALGRSLGPKNARWNGGIAKHAKGYILVKAPYHPSATKRGYVFEHRLVAEKILGRLLKPTEDCHHLNKNKTDNRPENLMVFRSRAAHTSFEAGKRVRPESIVFDGRGYHAISTHL